MLSLYGSFKVPGVDRATIFRDDEKPHKFYMLTDEPRVLKAKDGTPLMDFISYARNPDVVLAKLAEANAANGGDGSINADMISEMERGHLQVTVGLQIPDADQQIIRNFLKTKLQEEMASGYQYLGNPVTVTTPELGYPPFFLEGEASVNTFNDDLQVAGKNTIDPGKNGVCVASFSYDLSQEGAAFMLQALRGGSLPITATYEGLKFAARIPATTIRIQGNRKEIFKEFQNKLPLISFRTLNGQIIKRRVYLRPPTLTDFQSTFHNLTVTIDDGDFTNADASDDMSAALEEMALDVLEQHILPTFFEPVLEPPADDEEGSYWWLNNETTQYEGEIDLTFTKRSVILMEHSANGQIGGQLTEAEKDSAVRVLDLSNTEFTFAKLMVYPNINFETDPVFALQVFIEYDQIDEIENRRIRHNEEAFFKKGDGPDLKVFRLARAADGSPKWDYSYRSILTYTSQSTVPTVMFPETGAMPSNVESLVISYPMLGHIKSTLTLGVMPETVTSVAVTVEYPDMSLPDARQTFELTPDNPSAVYLLHTNRSDAPRGYKVTSVYRMADGSQITKGPIDAQSESFIVTSPFEDTVTTTFAASGDFTQIDSININAKYHDVANGHKQTFFASLTAAGQTATWTSPIVDEEKLDFTYDMVVFRKDGSVQETNALPGVMGKTIVAGPGGQASLKVLVDGGTLDWTVWSRVFVMLEYHPPGGGTIKRETLRITADNPVQEWSELIDDPTAITYKRRAVFAGTNGSAEIPLHDSTEPFFLLTPPEDDDA